MNTVNGSALCHPERWIQHDLAWRDMLQSWQAKMITFRSLARGLQVIPAHVRLSGLTAPVRGLKNHLNIEPLIIGRIPAFYTMIVDLRT